MSLSASQLRSASGCLVGQPRHRPAFTLLELILALSMVAVLAGSLFGMLRIGMQAQATAERAVAPSRTASVAFDFLRADFEAVMPPNSNSKLRPSFIGQVGNDDRGHECD